MRRKFFLISVFSFFCLSGILFAQQSRIVECQLEKVEDIEWWDKMVHEKLKTLYPDKMIYEVLSPDEFAKVIREPNVQLLDVRTEKEYTEGHIQDAILIDIKADDFNDQSNKKLDPEKVVAVYCKGGVRSRKAAEKLLQKGFNVYNLDRGFDQWKKAEKQVDKYR